MNNNSLVSSIPSQWPNFQSSPKCHNLFTSFTEAYFSSHNIHLAQPFPKSSFRTLSSPPRVSWCRDPKMVQYFEMFASSVERFPQAKSSMEPQCVQQIKIPRSQHSPLPQIRRPACTLIKGVKGGEGVFTPLKPSYPHHVTPADSFRVQCILLHTKGLNLGEKGFPHES